ncbi:MAG TPA: class I SAM-dependent methyltransferase [Bacillales bacterium]|nr:class I SAM-dependent methyltransferase [Bacillales bacterium]
MDRNKYSAIATRNHDFNKPISREKWQRLLDQLNLKPGEKIFDIGAGNCEIPIQFVEKFDVTATAVELYEPHLEGGKQRAEGRRTRPALDVYGERG